MNDNRRNFTFNTPNLLAKPIWKYGKLTHDSLIRILASSKEEANKKYDEYVRIGRRIGWYK